MKTLKGHIWSLLIILVVATMPLLTGCKKEVAKPSKPLTVYGSYEVASVWRSISPDTPDIYERWYQAERAGWTHMQLEKDYAVFDQYIYTDSIVWESSTVFVPNYLPQHEIRQRPNGSIELHSVQQILRRNVIYYLEPI